MKLTIAQIAAQSRASRSPVKLPGVVTLDSKSAQMYAELIHWDNALNILNALKEA